MRRLLPVLIPWILAGALGMALVQSRHAAAVQEARIAQLSRRDAELRYELKEYARKSEQLRQQAADLDSQLGSAKSRTTATQQALNEREQKEIALVSELAELRSRPAAASPKPNDPDTPTQASIRALEAQLTELLVRALSTPPPPVPANVPQVVKIGPQDAFVVLDYGTAHGARRGQLINLQRGTFILAQAQISDASPRYSVAQVSPTSMKGQLQTGDLVVFTQ